MGLPKEIRTRSSHGLISYVLDDDPHSTKHVQTRNLLVDGFNLYKDFSGHYNSLYTEAQFYTLRKLGHKENKATQAYHLIISFSDQEFPLTDDPDVLKKQAKQAMLITKNFLRQQLPDDSQYLLAVQRDGEGAKLHVHCAINSVLKSGKALDTNDLSIKVKRERVKTPQGRRFIQKPGLFDNLQKYLRHNFKSITGRDYVPVSLNPDKNKDKGDVKVGNLYQMKKRGAVSWREELKREIKDVISKAKSLADFKDKLQTAYHVRVKEYKATVGKIDGQKIQRDAYTYQILGTRDGKDYVKKAVRDYRVMGNNTIRGLGTEFRPKDVETAIYKSLNKIRQVTPLEAANEEVADLAEQDAAQRVQEYKLKQSVQNSRKKLADADKKVLKTVNEYDKKQQSKRELTPLEKKYYQLKKVVDKEQSIDIFKQAKALGISVGKLSLERSQRVGDLADLHLAVIKERDQRENMQQAQLHVNAAKTSQTASESRTQINNDQPSLTPAHNLNQARKKTKSESGEKAHDLNKAQTAMQQEEQNRVERQQQQRVNNQNRINQTKPKKKRKLYIDPDTGRPYAEETGGHDFIQNMPEPWKDNNENEKDDGLDK